MSGSSSAELWYPRSRVCSATSVHVPWDGSYSSGIFTAMPVPGSKASSWSVPPTASSCPSGSRTPEEYQRAWFRFPVIWLVTLPSASIAVSVVSGLAGSHDPGLGPSTPPQVTTVIWS